MKIDTYKIFEDKLSTILLLISSIFLPILGPFLALIISFVGIKKYLINSKDIYATLIIIFGFMFIFISVYFHASIIAFYLS